MDVASRALLRTSDYFVSMLAHAADDNKKRRQLRYDLTNEIGTVERWSIDDQHVGPNSEDSVVSLFAHCCGANDGYGWIAGQERGKSVAVQTDVGEHEDTEQILALCYGRPAIFCIDRRIRSHATMRHGKASLLCFLG
jgi:hypothetical protein